MTKHTSVLAQARDVILRAAHERGFAARLVRTIPLEPSTMSCMTLHIEGKYCRVEQTSPARARITAPQLKYGMLIILPNVHTEDCFIIPAAQLAKWLTGVESRSLQGFDVEPYRNAWHLLKETEKPEE